MCTKYCKQCSIELHDKNSNDEDGYCLECQDDFIDDMYEDFDE